MSQGLPHQFLARAAAFVVGLTLLLLVGVRWPAFYGAWALIAVAFLSEVLATVVYWRRSHPAPRGGDADR